MDLEHIYHLAKENGLSREAAMYADGTIGGEHNYTVVIKISNAAGRLDVRHHIIEAPLITDISGIIEQLTAQATLDFLALALRQDSVKEAKKPAPVKEKEPAPVKEKEPAPVKEEPAPVKEEPVVNPEVTEKPKTRRRAAAKKKPNVLFDAANPVHVDILRPIFEDQLGADWKSKKPLFAIANKVLSGVNGIVDVMTAEGETLDSFLDFITEALAQG